MSYCTIYNLFKVHFDTTAKFQISVFVERMTILKSECLDCDCICFSCMRTDVLILLGLESICFISFLEYYSIWAKVVSLGKHILTC